MSWKRFGPVIPASLARARLHLHCAAQVPAALRITDREARLGAQAAAVERLYRSTAEVLRPVEA